MICRYLSLILFSSLFALPAQAAVYNIHFEGTVWFSFGDIPITPGSRWAADFLVDSAPAFSTASSSSYLTTGTINIGGYTIYADNNNFSPYGPSLFASTNGCCAVGEEDMIALSTSASGSQKLTDQYYVNGISFYLTAPLGTFFTPGKTGVENWQSWDVTQLPWHQMYIEYATEPGSTSSSPSTQTFIDKLTVTEVPLPASGLLFSTTLFGIFAQRMARRRCANAGATSSAI